MDTTTQLKCISGTEFWKNHLEGKRRVRNSVLDLLILFYCAVIK